MRQEILKLNFEAKAGEHGWMLTSPDADDLKIFLKDPPDNMSALNLLSATIPLYLLGFGLSSQRHVFLLEDPSIDLQKGGKFSVIVGLKPP